MGISRPSQKRARAIDEPVPGEPHRNEGRHNNEKANCDHCIDAVELDRIRLTPAGDTDQGTKANKDASNLRYGNEQIMSVR